jgi:hypothetical protein
MLLWLAYVWPVTFQRLYGDPIGAGFMTVSIINRRGKEGLNAMPSPKLQPPGLSKGDAERGPPAIAGLAIILFSATRKPPSEIETAA